MRWARAPSLVSTSSPVVAMFEAAYGNPTPLAQTGQPVEYGAPAFGITAGANQAFRLVENQHPRSAGAMTRKRLSIESDGVALLNALAQPRRFAVNGHAALRDPLLDLAPRAVAHLGYGLLQLGRLLKWRVGHGGAISSEPLATAPLQRAIRRHPAGHRRLEASLVSRHRFRPPVLRS